MIKYYFGQSLKKSEISILPTCSLLYYKLFLQNDIAFTKSTVEEPISCTILDKLSEYLPSMKLDLISS